MALFDKRKYRKLPIAEITVNEPQKAHQVIAEKYDDSTLMLTFYRKNEWEFRVFCQEDDHIALVRDKRWSSASIMYLANSYHSYPSYWWSADWEIIEGKAIVVDMMAQFSIHIADNTAESLIEAYTEEIAAKRLRKKHPKELEAIDADMSKFPDIPADYDEFVKNRCFSDETYMFIDLKKKTAYCSKCGWDFDIVDGVKLVNHIGICSNNHIRIKHNSSVICPYCSAYEKAKNISYGMKKLFALRWSVLVQAHGDEVLTRYFRHTRDYTKDYRNPEYTISEQFRAVHTAQGCTDYEWNRFKNTNDIRWIRMKMNYSGFWLPSEYAMPRYVIMYNEHIDQDLQGTCMKYSCAKEYLDYVAEKSKDPRYPTSPWVVDQYFGSYRKYPWIEQIIKCNLVALVEEMLNDWNIKCEDIKPGRTICETLGISKNMFNILRKQNPAKYHHIEIMKYYKQVHNRDIKEREFDELKYIQDHRWSDTYKRFVDFMEYAPIVKLRKYMAAQSIISAHDYFDYIGWLREMGYDLHNEHNLYPKNFKRAHDSKASEYKQFIDKQAKDNVKKFNAFLQQLKKEVKGNNPVNLKSKNLFIRLPNELDELNKEGEALNHCVATYKQKVANGETLIYFVRQKSAPDKPFYTLEWKNNHIAQCRGKNNCAMTPEVKAFTCIFEQKMQEYTAKL